MTLLPVPRLRGLLQKRSSEPFWANLRRSLLAMAAGAYLLQRPPRIFDLCFFDSSGRMLRMKHCAASTCAGSDGEGYAYHGGASFAADSCDFEFGGDGHAALAAAPFSETRDPDQMSIFTGVAEGAADGRLACSAERTAWFEDDCCDFDLEVPEPRILICGSVPGNRTQEPERNQQDPQRAKNGVDNGPLPRKAGSRKPL